MMNFESSLTERSLQISNKHFSTALEQAALGFWEVSLAEGNAMVCTDQCKRNFGRDTELGFSYQDMLSSIVPEDQEHMQAAVGLAIAENAPYFSQYRVKHPDGGIRWIEAKGIVIRNHGIPEKIIGTTIDITKIKDLEILRDELLSFAMHELKTPLSAVKSGLQILERYLQKQPDDKILGVATRSLGSAERVTRLLNEMAHPEMAKVGNILLQKTTFDLAALVNEISANAAMLYPDLNLTIEMDEQRIIIFADRFRINQVITNLLNNAIKYSADEPEIKMMITTSQSAVIFKIADNGLGIAPEDRNKVFQKYYRSGSKRTIDGLGIGLYLCSEIIIRHGGLIGIEDTNLPGTVVYFTLPV